MPGTFGYPVRTFCLLFFQRCASNAGTDIGIRMGSRISRGTIFLWILLRRSSAFFQGGLYCFLHCSLDGIAKEALLLHPMRVLHRYGTQLILHFFLVYGKSIHRLRQDYLRKVCSSIFLVCRMDLSQFWAENQSEGFLSVRNKPRVKHLDLTLHCRPNHEWKIAFVVFVCVPLFSGPSLNFFSSEYKSGSVFCHCPGRKNAARL